jgi:hypothetical protein
MMKRVLRAVCLGTLVVAVQSASAQGPEIKSGYRDSLNSPFPVSADEHRALPAFTTFADTHTLDPKQYAGSPFPPNADEHRALPAFTTFADTHTIDPKQYARSPFPPNADEHRALAAFESYAERLARQAEAQRMAAEARQATRTE